jgi:hypothetical protein
MTYVDIESKNGVFPACPFQPRHFGLKLVLRALMLLPIPVVTLRLFVPLMPCLTLRRGLLLLLMGCLRSVLRWGLRLRVLPILCCGA